jgi:oxygen-independent coproporphyrinogen-3 oxidase
MSILCHNALDYSEISSLFSISFDSYFSEELCTIDIYEQQSLLTQTKTGFVVTDKGRLTIRKICMLFDAHLSNSVRENTRFSRII